LHLFEGIDFLIAIVGLFAISELFFFLEQHAGDGLKQVALNKLKLTAKDILFVLPASLRGALLGFVSGVLPGAGASLGSFVSYTLEKKVSDTGEFGKGDPRGVAAPEAGNNGAASGALVPMLTLGVPGSGTTAVLLAMLISLNVNPGPMLFQQSPDLVWGVIAALFVGNLVLLLLNIPMVGVFVKLLSIPPKYLMPIVTLIASVGIFSITGSAIDLYFMVGFGIMGYVLRKVEIPLVPVILGMLLGPEMEKNLRHALVLSDGDWTVLWSSGLSIGLWVVALAGLILPMVFGKVLRSKMKRSKDSSAA
jgi:putative tricarboxylic transport membrane protein